MRPMVSYTLSSFCASSSLNDAKLVLNMPLYIFTSCIANNYTQKAKLYSAKWLEKPAGHKLLTIHGVVAGRGELAEAAAHGEALSLGYRAGSAGETLFDGKVAL